MTTLPAMAERSHYYSTACVHLKHDKCKGKCGYCGRPCNCSCHTGPVPNPVPGEPKEEAMSTNDPSIESDQPTRTEADNDERDDERDDGTESPAEESEPGTPGDRY